jgi:hypothetical protein
MLSRRTINVHYLDTLKQALNDNLLPFFDEHYSLDFYCIYFDINLINGEVCVSLNTEFDYQRRKRYYTTIDKDNVVADLRYYISDWNYQGIVSVQPVDEDTFSLYYQKRPETFAKMCVLAIHEYIQEKAPEMNSELLIHFGDESLEDSRSRIKRLIGVQSN